MQFTFCSSKRHCIGKLLLWICFTLFHFRRLLMRRLRSTKRESLSLKGNQLVNLYLGTLYNCDWRATLKTHKKLHLNCVLFKKKFLSSDFDGKCFIIWIGIRYWDLMEASTWQLMKLVLHWVMLMMFENLLIPSLNCTFFLTLEILYLQFTSQSLWKLS